MQEILRDLRYGARSWVKSPGVSIVAVALLAVALAA